MDIVDVFRSSEKVMPTARDAVAAGAKVLWMQSGVKRGGGGLRQRARPEGRHGPLHYGGLRIAGRAVGRKGGSMARVCVFDVNETLLGRPSGRRLDLLVERLDVVGADLSEVANRILEVEAG